MVDSGPERARIDVYDLEGKFSEELYRGDGAWEQATRRAHQIGEVVASGYALVLPGSPDEHDPTYVPEVFWPERLHWLLRHDGTTHIQRVIVVMQR